MRIKQLTIDQFRLYDHLEILFHDNTNIFYGDNAQGKTTIIEAIYLLAFTKSHKTNKERELIQNSCDYSKIDALIHLKDKDIQLGIILSKAGKKAKYNQIELERLSDYIGQLNVVMFAPEDLDLIKGNPQNRRKFLDFEIGQISKEYLFNLQNYKRVLKQRNDLLKTLQKESKPDLLLLDILTDQLIGYLTPLVDTRKEFVSQIERHSRRIYQKIAKTKQMFKIEYLPSIEKDYKKEFIQKYQYDIVTGTTNIGVHRDDLEFYLDDFMVKNYGSQGELRSAVLATKLALIDFIYEHRRDYPILLLDDVFSELDIPRQNNLLNYIKGKTQTFITTTDLSDIHVENMEQYKLFNVKNGHIEESDEYGKDI